MTDGATTGTPRARLLLRLIGGDHPDGEVPLERLSEIARLTQELTLRMGREVSGREGAGRTPKDLQQATRLMLVGIRAGSTVLDIAGPPMEAQLALDDAVPASAAEQAMDRLTRSVEALSSSADAWPELSGPAQDSLESWVHVLSPYAAVEVTVDQDGVRPRSTSFSPTRARQMLRDHRPKDAAESASTRERSVEGELYLVNLHTGVFRLEDDLGLTISLDVPEALRNTGARFVGQRVRALGQGVLREDGRATHVAVTALEATTPITDLDDGAFWRSSPLAGRLSEVSPVRSVDALDIPGLTDEEAEDYWAALEDGRG